MTTRNRRFGVTAIFALLALAGLSCTNSDPLSSHPGLLTTTIDVTPAGSGGFDSFQLTLRQVGIISQSPATGSTIGSSSYGAIPSSLGVNFAIPGSRPAGSTSLSAGNYQVGRITFEYAVSGLFFSSNPVRPTDPCNPSNCLDYVIYRTATPVDPSQPDGERVNGKLPPPEVQSGAAGTIQLTNFASSPVFQVPESGTSGITLRFNGAQLAQLFRSGFACQCTGQCGSSITAPCVPLYTQPPLDQISALVSIQ